jgi:hypothetical protein
MGSRFDGSPRHVTAGAGTRRSPLSEVE